MAHDFNPRSPCGERLLPSAAIQDGSEHFNPRSPCGERLLTGRWLLTLPVFQSTLPVWGATYALIVNHFFRDISIHAPRVGSDRQGADQTQTETISIHAPRVGSDTADESSLAIAAISIHAPRVGSDSRRPGIGLLACISIHAPRVGSDGHHGYGGGLHLYFNPRSPCGERRSYAVLLRRPKEISIHAPRVGSDPSLTRRSSKEA